MAFLRQLNSPPAGPGVDLDPTLARRGNSTGRNGRLPGPNDAVLPGACGTTRARELLEAQARALWKNGPRPATR